ncbi:hypothetical protein [Streptomyces sp. MMS24-I29]|uniref:hypothetical protein n=1 Tax=Streptomyces sp. MMS24-I29 TaxID=3351480 RepID=UPI003C79C636
MSPSVLPVRTDDPDTFYAAAVNSESGIRTRLKELTHQGLVALHDEKDVSAFGNAAEKWVAVDSGDPSFAYAPDAPYIEDDIFLPGFLEAAEES